MADIETIAKGDGSRLVEPRRFLVRDRQAFAAIWAAHAGPDTAPPNVDFQTKMVAAVFAGERPQPGYEIAIAGTRRDGATLVVLVEEHLPDPRLVAAQIIVSPFHIAALPRDEGEVIFSAATGPQPQTIVFKSRPPSSSSVASSSASSRAALDLDEGISSTGLTPRVAAVMAYLAGPFSGALLLATERTSGFVRFHAWQAVLALGVLGSAAVFFLTLAFALLIVSPTAFWAMLWLAAATGAAWVALWGLCIWQAYHGRLWKLPLAGEYAERHAASVPTSLPASATP
jgi:uncharacterized membrane protein